MDLCTRVLTYMYNYIHNTSNHILLFPKSWNAVTVTNTITSESHIWIYVHIHVCTFACMYEHVYVYTNMYTYTHTHQRVTYLFSRNAKIAAAVTGTITSESHANTRSHTANTYWFGFILIFFFFFPKSQGHTYERVMSHIWTSHVTHMSVETWSKSKHMNESCHTYEWVMSHIWMSHVTRMNESCHTYERWNMIQIKAPGRNQRARKGQNNTLMKVITIWKMKKVIQQKKSTLSTSKSTQMHRQSNYQLLPIPSGGAPMIWKTMKLI